MVKKILCALICVLLLVCTIISTNAIVVYPVGDFEISEHNNNYGIYSFDNSSAVTTVYVYNEFRNKPIDYVFPNVFSGNTKISKIIFQENLIEIDQYVCLNNTNLESVTFPESLTTIGKSAFYNCPKLTKVTIGKNVTSIGERAFGNNSNLVISCYKDSYAQQYAVDNNIKYKLLDDPQPTEPTTESTTEPVTEATTEPTTVPTEPVKTTYLLGDGNDNNHIDISDATVVQLLMAKLIVDDTYVSQRININGNCDITNATLLQMYLAKLSTIYDDVIGTTREYIK